MKVVEFRLPLPLGIEDYRNAQLFGVGRKNLEDGLVQLKAGTADGTEVLESQPCVRDGQEGFYTRKRLSIASRLPSWVAGLVDPAYLTFEEESWNCYPRFETVYHNEGFKGFRFDVLTMHLEGPPTAENAVKLSSQLVEQREVINLDVVNDPISNSAYNPSDDLTRFWSRRRGWGRLTADWLTVPAEQREYSLITAYKVFIVSLPFLGFLSGRVETYICNAMRELVLTFHRAMVASMDQWDGLTLEDIRGLEEIAKQGLKQIAAAQQLVQRGEPPPADIDQVLVHYLDSAKKRQLESAGPGASVSSEQPSSRASPEESAEAAATVRNRNFVISCLASIAGQRPPLAQPSPSATTIDGSVRRDAGRPRYTGYLWKMSSSFFTALSTTAWTKRFVVLDGCTLLLYVDDAASIAQKTLDMRSAQVTYSSKAEDLGSERSHAVVVTSTAPVVGRLVLSADSESETKNWMLRLQLAGQTSTVHLSMDDLTPAPSDSSILQGEQNTGGFPRDVVEAIAADKRAMHILAHLKRAHNPACVSYVGTFNGVRLAVERRESWRLPIVCGTSLQSQPAFLAASLVACGLLSLGYIFASLGHLYFTSFVCLLVALLFKSTRNHIIEITLVQHWLPAFLRVLLQNDNSESPPQLEVTQRGTKAPPQEVLATTRVQAPLTTVIRLLKEQHMQEVWRVGGWKRPRVTKRSKGSKPANSGSSDATSGMDSVRQLIWPSQYSGVDCGVIGAKYCLAFCAPRAVLWRRLWLTLPDQSFILLAFSSDLQPMELLFNCNAVSNAEMYDIFHAIPARSSGDPEAAVIHRLSGRRWGGSMLTTIQQNLSLTETVQDLAGLRILAETYGTLPTKHYLSMEKMVKKSEDSANSS